MYAGGNPVLYPMCLIYLIVIYQYSKFYILKHCRFDHGVSERFVIMVYRTLLVAFIAHLVIQFNMFRNSDAFTNDIDFGEDASYEEKVSQGLFSFFTHYQRNNRYEMKIVELYLDFIIFVSVMYFVNLFLANPATFFLKDRLLFGQKSHQQAAENDVELANNIDKSSQSSQQSIKVRSCFTKGNQERSQKLEKTPSSDIFAEVDFNHLRYLYNSTIT